MTADPFVANSNILHRNLRARPERVIGATGLSLYLDSGRTVLDASAGPIMCGMGKTGTMHAWEQEGISGPDIRMIGKALGGGFVPLSTVLLREKIFDALAAGSGGLMHGHTFQAHPTACAAALEVQRIINQERLLENVVKMGQKLGSLLEQALGPMDLVGNVRGRGLFWAVEFMRDKDTKPPFESGTKFCDQVAVRALQLGLNIMGNLGKTGELHVEHVIICPLYIMTEAELRQMVSILKQAVADVSEEFSGDLAKSKI